MIKRYSGEKQSMYCLKDFIASLLFACFCSLCCLFLSLQPSVSQDQESVSGNGTVSASTASSAASASDSEPKLSTGARAEKIQRPQTAKSFPYPSSTKGMKDYFLIKYTVALVLPILCSIVMYLLLRSGAIAGLRNRLTGIKSYALRVSAFASCIYLASRLIVLPFHFYSGYIVEHQFSLSRQSLADWIYVESAHVLIGASIIPVLLVCFLLIRRYARKWVIPVWLFLSSLTIAVTFADPLVVEPVFNKFKELPACSLKTEIEELCHRAGLENPQVLVADMSKRTKKLNAYVSGLGASHRIVLYDTLLENVPQAQILSVVAHELGHYRLQHVNTGLLLAIVALLPVLFFSKYCLYKLMPFFSRNWGIKSSSDPALIAVVQIAIWMSPLVIAPGPAFVSRLIESEADDYGIRLTNDPWSSAEAFATLSRRDLSDPDPPAFIEIWFFSHPSLKHRIDNALSKLPGSAAFQAAPNERSP